MREKQNEEEEEGGLSGGAIAGIVIAVVLVVVLILLWRYKSPYIMQIFYTPKKTLSNNGGTAENSDPIIPQKWKCLWYKARNKIKNLTGKNVTTQYNDDMLLYKDGNNLHKYNTSGMIIKGLKPSGGIAQTKKTKVIFKTEQDFANEKDSIRKDRAIKELTDNHLLGTTLALPNSGLQSDVPEHALKEGEWCFAEYV